MASNAPGWQAAAWGWLAGTALQLQQPELSASAFYMLQGLAALALWASVAIESIAYGAAPPWRRQARSAMVALACAALAFSVCGLRATVFERQALAPALEGQDLELTGRVAAMAQRSEAGLRLRFAPQEARLQGQPVRVPPLVLLGWYETPAQSAADMRAGEQWRLTVRLKAPHGNRNPHGFDYELWLWEQGIQATGYVRAGLRGAAPERLAQTWRHPVERARQHVRDAIFERVADRQAAGILAALVTGDQNAIGC